MRKKIVQCSNCGNEWVRNLEGENGDCSNCRVDNDVSVVGEEVFFRGKFLYIECQSVDDLIHETEEQLEMLSKLKEEGFEVHDNDSIADDYIFLRKYYN